jgi:hypothetical protein
MKASAIMPILEKALAGGWHVSLCINEGEKIGISWLETPFTGMTLRDDGLIETYTKDGGALFDPDAVILVAWTERISDDSKDGHYL